MKTKAVRLYGKNDLRLEEFELPEIKEDEILAKVISDSICMSTHKAAMQGSDHKRVPNNIAEKPIITGHEFCGVIEKVGAKWADKFKEGDKFIIQPALNNPADPHAAPGYSFEYIGGDATYIVIPSIVMELDCLLPYNADVFFYGSLAEPMSCIIGGYHSNYHTTRGVYTHDMGIKEGGNCAILAGAGPMGLGAIDYAIHGETKPAVLVVTDINDEVLERASKIYTVEDAAANGVKLYYVNTKSPEHGAEYLRSLTNGYGYDDVFCYTYFAPVIEQADAILAYDGCLNFFAGPTDPTLSAKFNFYNVHYMSTHVVGNSGGNTDDMLEFVRLYNEGKLNPAAMITHIGGLNAVIDTTLNLDQIRPNGKKLVYTHIDLPLVAIKDMAELGKTDPLMAELWKIVEANNGLWCGEAEKYLLANAKQI